MLIYTYTALIYEWVDPKEFQSVIPMDISLKPQVKTLAPDYPQRSQGLLVGCPKNTLLVCIIVDPQAISFLSTGS